MNLIRCHFYAASEERCPAPSIPFTVDSDKIEEGLKAAFWESLDALESYSRLGIAYEAHKLEISRQALLNPLTNAWEAVATVMETKLGI